MKNIKRNIIAVLLLLSALTINAQESSRKEKMEALKIAYFTEKLDLSQQEAQRFWPVFNDYQKAKKNINPSKGKKRPDIDSMTDTEIENFINNRISKAQKTLDLRKEYLEKFKAVLPIRKVAKLIEAQKGFRKEILKRLKQKN